MSPCTRPEADRVREAGMCSIAHCSAPSVHPEIILLCADHLAVAAEAHDDARGTTDLLPSPCALCGSRIGARYPSGWLCVICEWPHGEHPDGELAPPRVDVVYYLRRAEMVKIGTTANPRQRFAAIPHDEVLAFERGDRRREQRRHRQFVSDRAGTSEWFRLSAPIRAHVDVLAGGRDPWDVLARWTAEATAVR